MITYENIAHNARFKCNPDINPDCVAKRAQDLDIKYNYKLATKIKKYRSAEESETDKEKIAEYFEKYIFIIP